MTDNVKTCAQHIAEAVSQRNISHWMQSGMPQDIADYGTQAEEYWDRRLDMLIELLSDESGYEVLLFLDACTWEFLAFQVTLREHDQSIRRRVCLEAKPTFGMIDVSAFNDAAGKEPADDDEAWAIVESVARALDEFFVHEYGDDDAELFGGRTP